MIINMIKKTQSGREFLCKNPKKRPKQQIHNTLIISK